MRIIPRDGPRLRPNTVVSALQEQNRNKTAIRDARAGTVGQGPNRDKTAICRTLIGPQSPSAGPSDDDEEEVCRPCLQPTSADYSSARSLRLFVSLPIFLFLCVVNVFYICSITLAGEDDRAAAAPAPAPASPAPERRRCWPSTRQQRQRDHRRHSSDGARARFPWPPVT